MNKVNSILKEVLDRVNPPKEELDSIKKELNSFLEGLKKRIKSGKLDVEVFIGGSFAKKTVIKKDEYDVDVFLRFDKKHEDISKLSKGLLKGFKNVLLVHGSRDYFRVSKKGFTIELIPVVKVKNPEESNNITDLSYSHVKYINKKIKEQKILDEIKIAKAFCFANNCYGAESYVNGFSGYALELLVYHYGSFVKMLKALSNVKEKIVIDIEKHYKNKQEVLMDINSSKLHSPIILVDPTFKQRNSLAALSSETFSIFQEAARKFLRAPSVKSFELEKIDLEKIKENAKNKKLDFVFLETKTSRQEGDIAGTKLLKFHKHLIYEIGKLFDIKDKGFDYFGKQKAINYFVGIPKKEIILEGPFVKDENNSKKFKKKHKNYFVKKDKLYSREKFNLSLKEFISIWKKKNSRIVKEMYIEEIKVD